MMVYLENARHVFESEIIAARATKDALGDTFERICIVLDGCKGRIVWTGMGKSGYICRKIAATMQSLGIKAQFMHPAEAMHGDLGMLTTEDIVIAVSNGGETGEVLQLIQPLKKMGIHLICIVGRTGSTLEKASQLAFVLPSFKEAYLDTLVPTSSTTTTLMVGDAIAVAIAMRRKFSADDFSVYHPNGLLGKRLTLTVGDIMLKGDDNAVIRCGKTVEDAIFEMCRKPLSGVNIVDKEGKLKGIFTDGDLRRLYKRINGDMNKIIVDQVMTKNPIKLHSCQLVSSVVADMQKNNLAVSFYPVVEGEYLIGTLRAVDIAKSGLI